MGLVIIPGIDPRYLSLRGEKQHSKNYSPVRKKKKRKRKMDKEVVVLMYNGISLSHEIHVIRLVAAR